MYFVNKDKIESLDNLFEISKKYLNNSLIINPFENFYIDKVSKYDSENLLKLLNKNIFVFDYVNNSRELTIDGKTEIITRANFSAFIKREQLKDFIKKAINHNIIIIAYDHIKNYTLICANNKVKKIKTNNINDNDIYNDNEKNNFKIVTKFEINYENFGNPIKQNREHIWNYGSDIDIFKNLFKKNSEQQNFINDNYIEICVIEDNFNKTRYLLDLCVDIVYEE